MNVWCINTSINISVPFIWASSYSEHKTAFICFVDLFVVVSNVDFDDISDSLIHLSRFAVDDGQRVAYWICAISGWINIEATDNVCRVCITCSLDYQSLCKIASPYNCFIICLWLCLQTYLFGYCLWCFRFVRLYCDKQIIFLFDSF